MHREEEGREAGLSTEKAPGRPRTQELQCRMSHAAKGQQGVPRELAVTASSGTEGCGIRETPQVLFRSTCLSLNSSAGVTYTSSLLCKSPWASKCRVGSSRERALGVPSGGAAGDLRAEGRMH